MTPRSRPRRIWKSPTSARPARADFLVVQQDLLARLMGEGPDATQNLFAGEDGDQFRHGYSLPARLPIELLAHRPDLASAMYRAEAAAKRIHMAKAEFLPSVDLTAVGGLEAVVATKSLAPYQVFCSGAVTSTTRSRRAYIFPCLRAGVCAGNWRQHGRSTTRRWNFITTLCCMPYGGRRQPGPTGRRPAPYSKCTAVAQFRAWRIESYARAPAQRFQRSPRGADNPSTAVLDQQFALKGLEVDHLFATVDLIQAWAVGMRTASICLVRN